jgi:hypothetical protein
MSSTTFSPETVQSVAEQRFDNSAVKRLKPNSGGPNTTEPPSVESAVARPNQTAAAIAVQTEVIETAVKDFATLNQDSLDAVTQASQILATGSLDLFRQMMASSQSAYAEALSGWRALANARTVKEQIEAQTSLVRSSTTWAITEGGRFTKASLDLAEKASSPLIARASRAAEMFQIPKV